MFGNKWNRVTSDKLNLFHVTLIKDYKSIVFKLIFLDKLQVAKECDEQNKKTIMDSLKFFELLNASRDTLRSYIPVKSGVLIGDCSEAQALRIDLENLDKLKQKIISHIDEIFLCLNTDNIIQLFIQVLQKRTTEITVLNIFL